MPAAYEFGCLEGLSKQSWLTKGEHDRFRKQCMRWKREHPKAEAIHEQLYEDILTNHLFLQRLKDKRVFLNGDPVNSYCIRDGRKEAELDTEDATRKAKEFEKWYPIFLRAECELMKLALATKIEITNADFDLANIIKEYQSETIGTNGESKATDRPCRCTIP